jgi:hypothetical protein
MKVRIRYWHWLVTALLLGMAIAALGLMPAHGSSRPNQDRPPECVLVKLYAPSGRIAWVDFCGGAGGQESPMQDWAGVGRSGGPLTMDGVRVLNPFNCPKAQPCVVLAENAPQS